MAEPASPCAEETEGAPECPDFSKRIPELDGLRGLAILAILIWHYVQLPLKAEPGTVLSYLKVGLSLAWSGVDLFFVLSGFLIGGILVDNRSASNYFRAFYTRRICRTFPLYYLLLALFLIILPLNLTAQWPSLEVLLDNPMPLWSYATFTQNICMALAGSFGAHWISVTWSLAIEEQFYLVFPWLVRFVRTSLLPFALVAGILLAPLLRIILEGLPSYILMICRIDALLMGALLAITLRQPAVCAFMRKSKTGVHLVLLFLAAGAARMLFDPGTFGVLGFTWLAAISAVLIGIALVHKESLTARIFRARWLVWLGTVSYGLFLFHQPVNQVAHSLILGVAAKINGPKEILVTLGALLVTCLLAQILHVWLEKPIIKIGHRIPYRLSEETFPAQQPRIP